MQVLPQILTLRCKFTGRLPLNMSNRFIRFGDPSLLISFLSPKVLMDENTKGWYIYTEARHHVMIPLWWLNIYKIWLSVSILFFALSIKHVSLIFFFTCIYCIFMKIVILLSYMVSLESCWYYSYICMWHHTC